MIFLTTGAIKFVSGIAVFVAGLEEAFAGKLPALIVASLGFLLPL